VPRLDEVFKKSGVPTHTFVAPKEYTKVVAALRTPGRCIIVEGPSGIGKTSCIKKALDDTGMSESCIFLSGRKSGDRDLISQIPTMSSVGIVIIDDFHRLPSEIKESLTDYVKNLADEEDETSKIILIGINRAGQALVEYAPDVLHRIEPIKFGRTNIERLRELVQLGERALNCKIAIGDQLCEEAVGSFAMAQVLCNETCLQADLLETNSSQSAYDVATSLPSIREAVLTDLGSRFFPVAREFATGRKLRREGRAPYLNLLRWLSRTQEGVLDTREAMAQNPELKQSVNQVIEKDHLRTLISESPDIQQLIHFESSTELLTVEDPKFLYFIRHLIWSVFARQLGYYSIDFDSRYDFALSFAGEDRAIAQELNDQLSSAEMSVFYDKQEQHRILANDVEEYLAPVYRSESRYVVPLLSKHYPKKIWTKFESEQFKQRFGENAVIPIWFSDSPPGMFDETRKYGGLTFNTEEELSAQVAQIVAALSLRLKEDRIPQIQQQADPDDPADG
jgi:hypothetical protein